MDLYISRQTVRASKYKEGLEDGFVAVPTASLGDEFKVRKECQEGLVYVPYLLLPGFHKDLLTGDEYIVTEDDGKSKYKMSEEDFNKKFRKVGR